MKIPLSRLRIAAYHMVVASIGALMANHGGGGSSASLVTPPSTSCLNVAI